MENPIYTCDTEKIRRLRNLHCSSGRHVSQHVEPICTHMSRLVSHFELPTYYKGDLIHDANAMNEPDIEVGETFIWILRECGTYIQRNKYKYKYRFSYLNYSRETHSVFVALLLTITEVRTTRYLPHKLWGTMDLIEARGI